VRAAGRARRWGWLLVAPSLALGATGLALDSADGLPDVVAGPPTVVGAVNGLVLSVVGALIVDHQPRSRPGWIIVVTGLLLSMMGFLDGVAVAVDPAGVAPPAAGLVWAANLVGMAAFGMGPALLFLFPDGRPPIGRWRWVFVASTVAAAVTVVGQVCGAWAARGEELSRFHLFWDADLAGASWGLTVAVWGDRLIQLNWLVGAAGLLVRYARARGVERQRLSWAVLGLMVMVLVVTAGATFIGAGVQLLVPIPLVAGLLIAIRRHQLLDADRVVRRVIVYTALTAVLFTGFVAIAVGLGAAAGRFAAGSSVAVAVATFAIVIAANPLRRTLQRQLDRRFDHRTWQAVAAVEAYTSDLRRGTVASGDMTRVLRTALDDPTVRIAYYLTDGGLVDDTGRPVPPYRDHDRTQRVVRIGERRVAVVDLPGSLAAAEPGLVEAALSAAALPLENAALHAQAAVQLAEVQDSRRRIIEAGDAERRRIERDLHDGAQQRLVAAALRLRRAERRLAGSDPQTAAVLAVTVDELRASIDELRDLTHGILPPVLADEGLAVALRSVTARLPLPVSLQVTAGRLPPTIEATAWFIVSEGLANAVKHAQPRQLGAAVDRRDGYVRIEVADDGTGGAAFVPGGGLQGLADRVAAVGGRFEVCQPATGGTTLIAELPCES
jgi:signal transduction histidine kinase